MWIALPSELPSAKWHYSGPHRTMKQRLLRVDVPDSFDIVAYPGRILVRVSYLWANSEYRVGRYAERYSSQIGSHTGRLFGVEARAYGLHCIFSALDDLINNASTDAQRLNHSAVREGLHLTMDEWSMHVASCLGVYR